MTIQPKVPYDQDKEDDWREFTGEIGLSSGAKNYDRYKLMCDTGAVESEMGSVPDRAAPGEKKKWFTHPTNPNLDGWYS